MRRQEVVTRSPKAPRLQLQDHDDDVQRTPSLPPLQPRASLAGPLRSFSLFQSELLQDNDSPLCTNNNNPMPTPTNLSVLSGAIQSHFILNDELGRGTYSKVYRSTPISEEALRLVPSCKVALKILNLNAYPEGAKRHIAQRVLECELHALSIVHNAQPQHVVRVYGIVREDESTNRVAIIMEELQGGELFERIVRQRVFSEMETVKLIHQVATGIDCLHRIGVIHRDIKPENIMYVNNDADSPCRIVDFGLSLVMGNGGERGHDPISEAGGIVGTVGYVAPEVIAHREYSPACDVWGLGVIMYILLCGYCPFKDRSESRTFSNILNERYDFSSPSWSRVSQSAMQLISRMLVVDPARRATLSDVLSDPFMTGFTFRWQVDFQLSPHPAHDEEDTFLPLPPPPPPSFCASADLSLTECVMRATKKSIKTRLGRLMDYPGPTRFTLMELEEMKMALQLRSGWACSRITVDNCCAVLADMFTSRGLPLNDIVKLFDTMEDCTLCHATLLSYLAMLNVSVSTLESVLQFCFDAYDVEGQGVLSLLALSNLLQTVFSGVFVDHGMTSRTSSTSCESSASSSNESTMGFFMAEEEEELRESVELLFERIGSSEDGFITFKEFLNVFMGNHVLKEVILGHDGSI